MDIIILEVKRRFQVKKLFIIIFIIMLSLVLVKTSVWADADASDMKTLFPQMDGWSQKGEVALYNPENLYEYINGAADVFLAYNLRQLATATFENKEKHSFTVDIYLHQDAKNGFGVYSQEKPRKGPFMQIGAQGYYEKGILNFLKGSYYVKMSGYDMGDKDKETLSGYAKKLSAKLKGDTGFPVALQCFPKENRVTDSEGYVANNFLGHAFLHSAYTVSYDMNSHSMQLFLMETKDNAAAKKIVDGYMAFLKKKGVEAEKKNGTLRFQDPYYRSSGKMNMKTNNNLVWGIFSKSDTVAEDILTKLEANLKKNNLIK